MEIYLDWIVSAWESLSTESIAKSFKDCGITICHDGSEDGLVHCFKEHGPIPDGQFDLIEARYAMDQVTALKKLTWDRMKKTGTGNLLELVIQNRNPRLYEEEMWHGEKEVLKIKKSKSCAESVYLQSTFEACDSLLKELITESFKSCGITNFTDGSEDDKIHCFKKDEVRVAGIVYCIRPTNYDFPDETPTGLPTLHADEHPKYVIVKGETVYLYEEDSGWFGDADDLLDKQETNRHGEFDLKGSENEFGQIEPYLYMDTEACSTPEKKHKNCKTIVKVPFHTMAQTRNSSKWSSF
uniref:Uncharacterized protein n=1 Tax=Ditylenchus dipsaci TaxID=166011 RepID=A0A915DXZ7_9BILA